ncbi:histidinol-phosphate transaminase [Microcella humidisoli]|uniref:Aromatic amino acid aminotransferase n=1 Tax=Microcella humidisoli TaxID=2963406 RepID=A0ABY5FZX8_9MICO|nr:histidinol-phosphate transaminase [Microcella humidisoli]UTT63467.1 histidinol-phosphate transaminase [Microcella humidisoli]
MTETPAPAVRLRPEIVALPAYKQGRAASPEAFKLSSNENPFPPHPAVLAAIRDLDINRYPDATALVVRERLAARHGVTPDEIIVGAGSVALLAQLISAAATVGDEVVFAWRSFEAYPGLVTVAGATSVRVPLTADARHDLPAMAASVTDRTRAVIVCTPNNPTGTVVTAEEFAQFMAAVPSDLLVILDEAYAEFIDDPAAVDGAELVHRYPNLVILRTFSKAYGLAGLRVGYAIGPVAVLDAARSTAIPLSVTEAAQRAVLAAMQVEPELLARVRALAARRDTVQAALREQGWQVPVSQGNFVWLPTGPATAAAGEAFASAGIVARVFPPEGIRVSIGEAESVESLLAVAGEVVRTL